MLSVNMLGIFAGIKVQSRRLNSFKATITNLTYLFGFSIECSFVFRE